MSLSPSNSVSPGYPVHKSQLQSIRPYVKLCHSTFLSAAGQQQGNTSQVQYKWQLWKELHRPAGVTLAAIVRRWSLIVKLARATRQCRQQARQKRRLRMPERLRRRMISEDSTGPSDASLPTSLKLASGSVVMISKSSLSIRRLTSYSDTLPMSLQTRHPVQRRDQTEPKGGENGEG